MSRREAGILLHLSSLPGTCGIGDLGPAAYRFVDFLKDAGQTYWQMLPIHPVDPVFGSSPYSSHSAFAGNPLFLSPEWFIDRGLLRETDVGVMVPADQPVDYSKVIIEKQGWLRQAFKRYFLNGEPKEFQGFCSAEREWLRDYGLFVVIASCHGGKAWNTWMEGLKHRDEDSCRDFRQEHRQEIRYVEFLQFCFDRQWKTFKEYCRKKEIRLIGDIPIYVNFNSADVWSHPERFKLDGNGEPVYVSGVPPDYFSATGQRWGTPVFDWPRIKEDGYRWWRRRLRRMFGLFEMIRIDHFRGLVQYWEIPAEEKTAINGRWVDGPKDDFLEMIRRELPQADIIAEDLGLITPDVEEIMRKFDLPGMKVMLFGFAEDKTHPYLPRNYPRHCVAYTGTHDNNTVLGWWRKDASAKEKKNVRAYFGEPFDEQNLPDLFLRDLYASEAGRVIVPLQDILGLGEESRMNIPGQTHGNWKWRFSFDQLTDEQAARLRKLSAKRI